MKPENDVERAILENGIGMLHEIGSPMIPEDQYAAIVNGGV